MQTALVIHPAPLNVHVADLAIQSSSVVIVAGKSSQVIALQTLLANAHPFIPVDTTAPLQALAPAAVNVAQSAGMVLHYPVHPQFVTAVQPAWDCRSLQVTLTAHP